jgi:D-3-phosphoglycerate dehydrogenase
LLNDRPLRGLDNIILTPHTAGMQDGLKFHQKCYEYFFENIIRVSEGKTLVNALN